MVDAQSQNITYRFNDPFKLPAGHKDIGFFGSEQDGFVQLSFDRGSDLISQKINAGDYKVISEEKMDVSIFPKNFMNEVFVSLQGNNNYWFYSLFEKEKEREVLSVKKVDLKTNKFSSDSVRVLECNRLKGVSVVTGLYQSQIRDKYDFFPSADSSKLLVKYVLKEREENEKIGIFVFDSKMQKIWGKEVDMPYPLNRTTIYGYYIDNKASVYILLKVKYEDWKDRKKDKLPFDYYEVLKLSNGSTIFQLTKLEFEDKFIQSVKMVGDLNNNVIIAGYYSHSAKNIDKAAMKKGDFFATKKSIDGVFLQKLNANGGYDNIGTGFYEFSIDVITAYEKDPVMKDKEYEEDKDNAEIDYLDLDHVKFDEAGNIVIIGEQYHAFYREIRNSQTMQVKTRVNHYFEDIVAVKIGSDNAIKWVVKIPKNQRHMEVVNGQMSFQAKKMNIWRIADGKGSFGHKDMSYYHDVYNNEDYFYYMDNVKNANLLPDQKPVPHASGLGGYLMVAKISTDGKLTKVPVFDIKNEDVKVRPTHFYKLSKNKIIGLCKIDEGYSILEIKLP